MAGARRGASSAERVLDVLLAFGGVDGPISARAIARRFGTSRSSTYRYLQMLRARDLIEETHAPGQYRLSAGILALARGARAVADIVAAAAPVMDALSLETGETVLLTRRVGDRAVCVACVESRQAVRIAFEPARNTPLHAGSVARVHLAHLEPAEIDRLLARPLERLTARTPTDPTRLRMELAAIRRRGWASSEGEVDPGVRSLSVPVFDGDGAVAAGLTLAGPSFRLTGPVMRGLVPKLLAAAGAIEARAAAPSPTKRLTETRPTAARMAIPPAARTVERA